ncbi:MAG: hypothetical protein DWQ07_02215 [Chloroflexi bacterium]|nr:MAG: hypothetical protein DWQ07_02215 [Chloroflexota bacterium]MBL1193687.1 hypothetical protein [Chloroflexota bacterium]NOH10979.1 polysaccharide deacetylase family protein [Chloroflexota bacterium]
MSGIVFILVLLSAAFIYLVIRRVLRVYRHLSTVRYPNFVYEAVGENELGIPVFTYHSIADPNTPDSVTVEEFENHVRYLAENGYTTIVAEDLYGYLAFRKSIPKKSVVITFDDGRATQWTIAYPILKKYGLKAVYFIVPGLIQEAEARPNLENLWAGEDNIGEELVNADIGTQPMVSWEEVKIMHRSGVIDFQSHTMDHTLIFHDKKIEDFVHPDFNFGYHGFGMPLLKNGEDDYLHSRPAWGAPIYRNRPRMYSARRFFDDENLRKACVTHVEQNGGSLFFQRNAWRDELFDLVENYRRSATLNEYYETQPEQLQAYQDNLVRSKSMIEERLPGHSVRHLCYPWHRYSVTASSLATAAGYVSTFVDINSQKVGVDWYNPYEINRPLPTNEFGDDPNLITRIDGRDNIALSLPGKGRVTYQQRILSRVFQLPSLLQRLV